MLIGGASAHADFNESQLEGFLAWLQARIAHDGGSVLATTSRRTPRAAGARLRERLQSLPGVVWTHEGQGPNPYAGLLGWADRIICTADSVNMLSEAAATNVPVYVAGVERVSGRPRRFVDSLLALGRVRSCGDDLQPFPAIALRETARVADEVRARLGL